MHIGPIVKILKVALVVALAVTIAYPFIAFGAGMAQGNSMEMGVEARYDLDVMTQEQLESNMLSVAENYDDNLYIFYGDHVRQFGNNTSTVSAVATEVMASGESTAFVKTSDNNMAHQQTIAFGNEMYSYIRTGFIMPGEKMGEFISADFNIIFNGNDYRLPLDGNVFWEGNNLIIELEIPYMVVMVAMADKCGSVIEVSLGYLSLMSLNFTLDYPMFDEIGENISFEKVETSEGYNDIISTEYYIDVGTGIDGSIGDVPFKVTNNGNRTCVTVYGGAEKLRTSLNNDHYTVTYIDGEGVERTFDLDKTTIEAIVQALESMEA